MENIWKLMKEYDFPTDINIEKDLICVICKKIMIKACNGPCGCRYCSECIMKHLDSVSEYCPGKIEFCQNKKINFKENILIDQPINIRISTVNVKCPNQNCQFKDELKNMENHLMGCDEKSVSCPFFGMGCNQNKFLIKEMKHHLSTENSAHCNLLIEWINNISNEVGSLNKEINYMKTEIKYLKNENEKLKMEKENSQTLIRKLENKEDQNIVEIKPINSMKNTENNRESSPGINEIVQIMSDLNLILTELDGVCKEFDIMKQDHIEERESLFEYFKDSDKKQKSIFSKLNEINQRIAFLTTKSVKVDKSLENIEIQTNDFEDKMDYILTRVDTQSYGYFMWNIENFSEKIQNAKNWSNPVVYSYPFYTHKYGYKMRLCVYPDGNGDVKGLYLSIYFCIVRGQFDNILQWPIKPSVILELISQETGQVFISKTAEYDDFPNSDSWKRPITEKNNGLGFIKFIKLDDLKNNPALIKDDKLFIKCTVNMEL